MAAVSYTHLDVYKRQDWHYTASVRCKYNSHYTTLLLCQSDCYVPSVTAVGLPSVIEILRQSHMPFGDR